MELSEYEKQRLSNIKRNHAVMLSLGLEDKEANRREHARIVSEKRKRQREEKASRAPRLGERKSRRLEGHKADGIFVDRELAGGRVEVKGEFEKEPETLVLDDEGEESEDESRIPITPEELTLEEREAYESLRKRRAELSRALQIEPYKIAHNRTLCSILTLLPKDVEGLLECWGMGPKKASTYGPDLLETLEPWRAQLETFQAKRQAEANVKATPSSAKKGPATGSEESPGVGDAMLMVSAAQGGEEGDDGPAQDVDFTALPLQPSDLTAAEHEAFIVMREWKRATAKAEGYSNPCVVCHNRTLCEIVRVLPRNTRELLQIWGISSNRAAKYGRGILDALRPLRKSLLNA